MKKRVLPALALALSLLFAASACAGAAPYSWELTDLGTDVSIHTAIQAEFLAGDYNNIAPYADGMSEKSLPEAVRFEWEAAPAKSGVPRVTEYVVEISKRKDFRDKLSFKTAETKLDVYNLYIATDYYWRVTALLANGKESVSQAAAFSTSGVAPRNLYVDGITNVRDLGGWEIPDGRVRQGAIIRCGRLNESETEEVNIEITQKGIDTMLNELGVKTEIDLRDPVKHDHESGGITSSPLGDSVTYINIPLEWNVSNLLTGNTQAVLQFFEVIADESNYPLIYHCNIGTDRTGLFAFLINGLLGVDEDDLYRDYMFSNFGKINDQRYVSNIANYVNTIKGAKGFDLSEKIENYLLGIGVTKEQLDNITDYMTE